MRQRRKWIHCFENVSSLNSFSQQERPNSENNKDVIFLPSQTSNKSFQQTALQFDDLWWKDNAEHKKKTIDLFKTPNIIYGQEKNIKIWG